MKNSLIADGCTIHPGTKIENSIIGLRCQIGSNVTVRDSIVMGADYFETPEQVAKNAATGGTWLGIGEGAIVERAIVDKNCRIGAGAHVACNSANDSDLDLGCCTRDGVLVVPKSTIIPPGWRPQAT